MYVCVCVCVCVYVCDLITFVAPASLQCLEQGQFILRGRATKDSAVLEESVCVYE